MTSYDVNFLVYLLSKYMQTVGFDKPTQILLYTQPALTAR